MGIDTGFDMVPRLSKGLLDQQNWDSFISSTMDVYSNDEVIEIKPNYIEFNVGEHPRLPLEGHKSLRFSSKISGRHAGLVEQYLDAVSSCAMISFGPRIKVWNEVAEVWGHYSWSEVNDAQASYEQVRHLRLLDERECLTLAKRDELVIPATGATIAQAVLRTDPLKEIDVPLFEIMDIPGKGKGLVSRFNLSKGTRVVHEKPLFTTQPLSSKSMLESDIATKLKKLSKNQQRDFLQLHNNHPGNFPFSGIVRTNALPCGVDSSIGGIYPTLCRINHSCLPNAHHSWNSATGYETIHALRYIRGGEEISISYGEGPSFERRKTLKERFGFDCNCKICSLPPSKLQESDARRLIIHHLDDRIGDAARVLLKPVECLADCFMLLQAIKVEYIDTASPLLARLYYDAFQIVISHGDQARATIFAGRAYEARVTIQGDDSPETQRMKMFKMNPASHGNYGASKKWKTAKRLVPKELNADAFEMWLWRQTDQKGVGFCKEIE